jgi:hypothetical protein
MNAGYFVLLINPSNGARFALVKDECQEVAIYETITEARKGAENTLFGAGGHYDVFDVNNPE